MRVKKAKQTKNDKQIRATNRNVKTKREKKRGKKANAKYSSEWTNQDILPKKFGIVKMQICIAVDFCS